MSAIKEASIVFGSVAVQAVLNAPELAEKAVLSNGPVIYSSIRELRPRLSDMRAAVAYGQELKPEIRDGIIFLWLGLSKKLNTVGKLGLYEKPVE